jgi:AcrR family transcriptional regulator
MEEAGFCCTTGLHSKQACLLGDKMGTTQAKEKKSPRARILEAADRLFYTEGVHTTGTERIMAESGVAKATFYRHFDSKDNLVLAYLEDRKRQLWEYINTPEPPTDIFAALQKLERQINTPGVIGCPFIRIASEFPDTAHPFHQHVIEQKDKMQAFFSDLLKPLHKDHKIIASQLLALVDGCLTLRMVYGQSRRVALMKPAEALLAPR